VSLATRQAVGRGTGTTVRADLRRSVARRDVGSVAASTPWRRSQLDAAATTGAWVVQRHGRLVAQCFDAVLGPDAAALEGIAMERPLALELAT